MKRKQGESLTDIESRLLQEIKKSPPDTPIPLSRFAFNIGVTSTTIRNYLRAFENSGYITRKRRATNSPHIIALTESGARALEKGGGA